MATSRARHYWRLTAYAGIVALTALGLYGTEHRDATHLRALQDELCRSVLVVKANQRFVLATLQEWNIVFSDRSKAGLRPVPPGFSERLNARLARLNARVVCHD